MPLPGSHQLALVAEAQGLVEDHLGGGYAHRGVAYQLLADLIGFGIEYRIPICTIREDDWRELAVALTAAAERLGSDPAYVEMIPPPAEWTGSWLQWWADLRRKIEGQLAAELGDRDRSSEGSPLTDAEMVKVLWRVVKVVKDTYGGIPRGRWLDKCESELEQWMLALGERHVSGSLGQAGVAYDPAADTAWSMPKPSPFA